MPSPFPGMDPYIEDPDLWPDVHHGIIAGVQEYLSPQLRPRYMARFELRTFLVEPDDPAEDLYVIPDARIVERAQRRAAAPVIEAGGGGIGGVAVIEQTAVAPIDVTNRLLREARHRYLEIRDTSDRRVVTIIEIVSPSNKIIGSAGRRAFREKRDEVHDSDTSWIEIDLLRAGTRTVNIPRFPPSAYFAYADRTARAPAGGEPGERRLLAWPIALRERLPVLPVPLRPDDPDVKLDLQAVLNAAYDRAAYDLEFDYALPPASPLDEADAQWADTLLREKGLRA